MGLTHPTAKSFSYALSGLKTALKQEPNFRIHLGIAILTMLLALWLGFTTLEWIILIFTIGFVLTLELVNTALEALVNIVSPQIHNQAKIAKDVSAAAVLISAIIASLVGIFLFLPKLY